MQGAQLEILLVEKLSQWKSSVSEIDLRYLAGSWAEVNFENL